MKTKISSVSSSKFKVTSVALNEQLMVGSISGFLTRNKTELFQRDIPSYLKMLLSKKKLKRADVVKGSYLAKAYVYEIFSGKKKPSRDALLAIAIGMELSVDEIQQMLKYAGIGELYIRDERDAVILYAIHHRQSVVKTNILLEEYGFPVLVNFER